MKTTYVISEYRAIADVVPDFEPDTYLITRINVPYKHRGQGIGSRLLAAIITDADAEGVTLTLHVLPSGELGYGDLCAWYERRGFVYSNERCCYVRTAQGTGTRP